MSAGKRGLNENGWRDHIAPQLRQLYTDLGMRNGAITANISFTAAPTISPRSARPRSSS